MIRYFRFLLICHLLGVGNWPRPVVRTAIRDYLTDLMASAIAATCNVLAFLFTLGSFVFFILSFYINF